MKSNRWLETLRRMLSLPVRERGLKFSLRDSLIDNIRVAPCAGAWIEMESGKDYLKLDLVAPCAGAWIEIITYLLTILLDEVAPCAGAWIEMTLIMI